MKSISKLGSFPVIGSEQPIGWTDSHRADECASQRGKPLMSPLTSGIHGEISPLSAVERLVSEQPRPGGGEIFIIAKKNEESEGLKMRQRDKQRKHTLTVMNSELEPTNSLKQSRKFSSVGRICANCSGENRDIDTFNMTQTIINNDWLQRLGNRLLLPVQAFVLPPSSRSFHQSFCQSWPWTPSSSP